MTLLKRMSSYSCSVLLTSHMLQAKQDTTELQEKSKAIKKSIAAAEESAKELAEARDKAIMPIGNLVPDSVPVSNDEVSYKRCPVSQPVLVSPVAERPASCIYQQ